MHTPCSPGETCSCAPSRAPRRRGARWPPPGAPARSDCHCVRTYAACRLGVCAMATIVGLELTAVHVNAWVDWVFVHVQTDTGVQGLGELSVRPAADSLSRSPPTSGDQ